MLTNPPPPTSAIDSQNAQLKKVELTIVFGSVYSLFWFLWRNVSKRSSVLDVILKPPIAASTRKLFVFPDARLSVTDLDVFNGQRWPRGTRKYVIQTTTRCHNNSSSFVYRGVHEPASEGQRRRNYYCPGRESICARFVMHTLLAHARWNLIMIFTFSQPSTRSVRQSMVVYSSFFA